jgi:SAM-dependent methyltransferase
MTNTQDLQVLKARLKATWMAGDFGEVARYSEDEAERFIARRGNIRGFRLLDVACGTGNLCLPAARGEALVTGLDIAPNLLDQARARAKEAGLHIHYDEGDAEALPYPDGSFDLVVSMFGAMFAPRPEWVAAELSRVCRPQGGQIVMANWTPRGFIGEMFRLTAAHIPPPPGVPPPVLWGDEATVRQRLGQGIAELHCTPVLMPMRLPFTVLETIEFYRSYYGPTQKAFAALPVEGQDTLRRDLHDLWTRHNRGTDGSVLVEAEYLEVVATRA